MSYRLEELSKEEGEALTNELQAVLEKHGAEMSVKSTIELSKRVEVKDPIPSPFLTEEK